MVKLSALLKPKDTAVAAMSFSMDLGTHTALSPLRCSLKRMLSPRPPTTEITASMLSFSSLLNRSSDMSISSTMSSSLTRRTWNGSILGAWPSRPEAVGSRFATSSGLSVSSPPSG